MKTLSHQVQVRQRSVALAGSIALHLALLLALLWPAAAERRNDKNADTAVDVRLIQDAGRIRPYADALNERTPDKPADGELASAALSKCDGHTYTGIGVRVWDNGAILEVASGGPADKAGLRAGDTLLNSDVTEPDQHKSGTPITLHYLRDEREMPPVVAVIEKICNEEARPPTREPDTV
jgi:predicted metalloprotease with PDZ domain